MTPAAEQKAITEIRPGVPAHGGALTFTDIESLQRLSKFLLASKMMPKQYDTMEKIGAGIQFAVQVGFKTTWLLALRQIAVINGTPSLFGDLPLALARNSGQLEEFEEWLYDKDHVRICVENKNTNAVFIGAACKLKRKGYPAVTKNFTVEDAKTAGVWDRNVWKPYPKRMIQMRTRSIALKDEFADILNGMSIGEYDHNTVIERVVESEVTDANPANLTGASKLNAMAAQQTEPAFTADAEEIIIEADAEDTKQPEASAEPTVSTPTDQPEDGEFGAFNETRV